MFRKTKDKKYVFILSFHIEFAGNIGSGMASTTIESNKKQLHYSDVIEAQKNLVKSIELKTTSRITGAVLINCTRTLHDA